MGKPDFTIAFSIARFSRPRSSPACIRDIYATEPVKSRRNRRTPRGTNLRKIIVARDLILNGLIAPFLP